MSFARVLQLGRVFLKLFFRDRSAFILGTLFPIVFLLVLGGVRSTETVALKIGLAGQEPWLEELPELLAARPELDLQRGEVSALLAQLEAGELQAVLLLPESPDAPLEVRVRLADDRVNTAVILQTVLAEVERELRGLPRLFVFEKADGADEVGYMEFLLPGLLAFSIMQISFAGSGYNLVEYRRKGILKRLFVTPLLPVEFILAIGLARTLFCLAQLLLVVLFARLALGLQLLGSPLELLLLISLGCFIFLCLGFAVGSVVRTQQAIGSLGSLITFPQIILSSVFFPLELLPEPVQLAAHWLPLTFLVAGLREVAAGASLFGSPGVLAGVLVWCCIAFVLATRLFDWKRLAN